MTVAQSMPTEIERRWQENFIVTLQRLMELLETEEEEDEYGILKPTDYAFQTVIKLLLEAGSLMGSNFPKGSACPDDRGGIRLESTSLESDREVCLVCPFNSENPVYIYRATRDNHTSEDVISASNLVNSLKWFNGE